MRIALVTESFPPDVNGVANSVLRAAEHLARRGHHPLVITPAPASGTRAVNGALPFPVVRVPSLPLPGYPQVRLGLPTADLAAALREHRPDVIHLASPFVLGAKAATLARGLAIPAVAVYQTDIPGYARAYRVSGAEAAAWRRLRRIHNAAARTLAPSTQSATALHSHGIQRVWLWRRGVDSGRFHPDHRSAVLRRALAPDGEVLVGYVGRLSPEKRVDLLSPISRLPGVRLVIVGDGPAAATLRRQMPGAAFLGPRGGAQLACIYASLDVFAHAGPYETFGQAIQEALASGVPVVAPAAGGPVDLVEPGRTGHLVVPLDSGALVAAVADLVNDPDRRVAWGRAARASVENRTWTTVGDELVSHYIAVHSGDWLPSRVGTISSS